MTMIHSGEALKNIQIGIVGCGHLGETIAKALLAHGLRRENLKVSYRGSPETLARLETAGLGPCIAETGALLQTSDIIFITVKPGDALTVPSAGGQGLKVSCVAGVPLEVLQKAWGEPVCRMMVSGPDTILSGKGVAAVYPVEERAAAILEAMELRVIRASQESDIDVFTAGVCLTAAMLEVGDLAACEAAIDRLKEEYPLIHELYPWARGAMPECSGSAEKEAYIGKMATKGGVTEAIIRGLREGEALDGALRRGIARMGEISSRLRRELLGSE